LSKCLGGERLCDIFCKKKKMKQRELRLRESWGSPDENSEELLKLITSDFDKVRARKDPENLFVGRFFSIALLIESRLELILKSYEPDIERATFGIKIDIFSDLLKDLGKLDPDIDVEVYREFLGALREIANIRNEMAHDLEFIYFPETKLGVTKSLIKKYRKDLFDGAAQANAQDKPLVLVASFGFVFASRSGFLLQHLHLNS
jgi:hypothetical protein